MTLFSDDVLMLNAAQMEEWYEHELIVRAENELRQKRQIFGTGQPAAAGPFIFGLVADRVNLLKPSTLAVTTFLGNPPSVTETQSAANNVNQWISGTPHEFSLNGLDTPNFVLPGDFTTAPDGTFTAQKMIENTNNGEHPLHAGLKIGGQVSESITLRCAIFAKAAGRSRFRLEMATGDFGVPITRQTGVRCTFDVSTGQVVIAPASYGDQTLTLNINTGPVLLHYTAVAANVTPGEVFFGAKGKGWYLCTLDVKTCAPHYPNDGSGAPGNDICCTINIDGSGSGASNVSYPGDGVSGIYFWRSCMLPPGAFSLNTQAFFDDFLSISTIDVNDTRAPGFNWYPHLMWPAYTSIVGYPIATRPAFFTVGNSIVKILQTEALSANICLSTCAWDQNVSFIGRAFQPPFYTESKMSWHIIAPVAAGTTAYFTYPIEEALGFHLWDTADPNGWQHYDSVNFTLFTNAMSGVGSNTLHFAGFTTNWAVIGAVVAGTGIAKNCHVVSTDGFNVVIDKLVIAPGVGNNQAIHFSWANELDFVEVHAPNNPNPATHTVGWGVISLPGFFNTGAGSDYPAADDEVHTYQTMWLPETASQFGMFLHFRDGIGQQGNTIYIYSATDPGTGVGADNILQNGKFNAAENKHYNIIIGGGGTDGNMPASFDTVGVWTT